MNAVALQTDPTPVQNLVKQLSPHTASVSVASPPLAAKADDATLSLIGTVQLPTRLQGLANAQNGVVAGAPVVVTDVETGKRIGQGVTYYDGSYEVDVPASLGARPVVVQVMLVDAKTKQALFPVEVALELSPALSQQQADIGAGSTAWVALLYNLAARQDKAPTPDWTKLTPGRAALTLAGMIEGNQAQAQNSFLTFAKTTPGFTTSASPAQLRAAIQGVVDLLLESKS